MSFRTGAGRMELWEALKAQAAEREFQRIEKSFDREWYTVSEASHELNKRGADIHLETLRRWIRSGKVKVNKPSPRKTLIPARELARLLMSRP